MLCFEVLLCRASPMRAHSSLAFNAGPINSQVEDGTADRLQWRIVTVRMDSADSRHATRNTFCWLTEAHKAMEPTIKKICQVTRQRVSVTTSPKALPCLRNLKDRSHLMTISRIHLDGLTSQKMSKLPNFPMQRANNQTGTETFIYIFTSVPSSARLHPIYSLIVSGAKVRRQCLRNSRK